MKDFDIVEQAKKEFKKLAKEGVPPPERLFTLIRNKSHN